MTDEGDFGESDFEEMKHGAQLGGQPEILTFNDLEAILKHNDNDPSGGGATSMAQHDVQVPHRYQQTAGAEGPTIAGLCAPDDSAARYYGHYTHGHAESRVDQRSVPPRWPSSLLSACQEGDGIPSSGGGPSSGSGGDGHYPIAGHTYSSTAHVPAATGDPPMTHPGAHTYLHAGTEAGAEPLPNSMEDAFEPFPLHATYNLPRPDIPPDATDVFGTMTSSADTMKTLYNTTLPLHLIGAVEDRTSAFSASQFTVPVMYGAPSVQKAASEVFQTPSCHESDAIDTYTDGSSTAATASVRGRNKNLDMRERILELDQAMDQSQKTQRLIQEWDKRMGLKRSHSKTMRESMASRKMVQEILMRDMLRSSLFAPKTA